MRELASSPKEVDVEELEELYLTQAKSVESSTRPPQPDTLNLTPPTRHPQPDTPNLTPST